MISKRKILKIKDDVSQYVEDNIITEEPLEIRLCYGDVQDRKTSSIAITMRTPGDDEMLALGFLKNEGLITKSSDILKITKNTYRKGELNENIITIHLSPNVSLELDQMQRNFYSTSSCGICGKASIEAMNAYTFHSIELQKDLIHKSFLLTLPEKMNALQRNFQATGGNHACGLFDTSGKLLQATEDVGRHNALDKLSGKMFSEGMSGKGTVLMLSGRASFELIQKSNMNEIPVVCAIGAPSSLAIEAAEAANITLIGFLKSNSFNIYTCFERITL